MLLQFGALGVTMSWDEGFLGARASRPHKAWHSLGHLPHLDQPRTAPWLSFGLADAVPTHRVAACSIARKFSGGQRDRMRAGRPRSQAPQDGADHSRVKQRPQRCQQRPQRCPCVVVLLIRRLRGCGSAGFTRPRAHARGYLRTRLRRFIRRPVGDVCSADLRQPRLRRSPLSHNTAGG